MFGFLQKVRSKLLRIQDSQPITERIFNLRHGGKTYNEICRELNLPMKTVKYEIQKLINCGRLRSSRK